MHMANEEQLKLLQQGIKVWNQWRKENASVAIHLQWAKFRRAKLEEIDLSYADLRKADLREAKLTRANLRGAKIQESKVQRALLYDANLREVKFTRANLQEANFFRADLSYADLRQANLAGANLTEADLSGADLTGAVLRGAVLRGAKFQATKLQRAYLRGADLTGAKFQEANLQEANLSEVNLTAANFTESNLTNATLIKATLVSTTFTRTTLTGAAIFGISAWKVDLTDTVQTNLTISDLDEPIITVDDLEVAQLIYLLLNHKKLRNVLNSVTERGVLILGRFGDGGLNILQSIAAKIRDYKYLPIIFDFDRPDDRNFTETIKTLVSLSRFVIVDLSGPSVPQELYATIPHFKIPFAPILEERRQPFSMSVDLFEYPWVLPLLRYSSIEQLIEELATKVIMPAEEKHKARQVLLAQLFYQSQ